MIVNKKRKQLETLANALLWRVNLPPFNMRSIFQELILLKNLSTTGSQSTLDLNLAQRGRPKQEARNWPTLHPKIEDRRLISLTSPTWNISHFDKLILRPETTSKQHRMHQNPHLPHIYVAEDHRIINKLNVRNGAITFAHPKPYMNPLSAFWIILLKASDSIIKI